MNDALQVKILEVLIATVKQRYTEQQKLLDDVKQLFDIPQTRRNVQLARKVVHELILEITSEAPAINFQNLEESFKALRLWLENAGIYFDIYLAEFESLELPYHVSAPVYRIKKRHVIPVSSIKAPGFQDRILQSASFELWDVAPLVKKFFVGRSLSKEMEQYRREGKQQVLLGGVAYDVSGKLVAHRFIDDVVKISKSHNIGEEHYMTDVMYNEFAHILFDQLVAPGDYFGTFDRGTEITRGMLSEAFSDYISLVNTETALVTLLRLEMFGKIHPGYAYSNSICEQVIGEFTTQNGFKEATISALVKHIRTNKQLDMQIKDKLVRAYASSLVEKLRFIDGVLH